MQPKTMSDALYAALAAMFTDAAVLKEVADKLDDQGFDTVESLAAETVHTLVSLYKLKGAHARKVATALGAEGAATPHSAPAAGPLHVTVSTEKTPMTMPRRALLDLFASGNRDAEVLNAMRDRAPLVLTDKATPAVIDAAETESWLASPARNARVGDTVRGHFKVRAVEDIVSPTVELDPVTLTELDAGFNGATDWRPFDKAIRAFLYFVFHVRSDLRPVTTGAAALDALDAARNDLSNLYGRAWKQAVEAWADAKHDDPALEGKVLATLYPTRASLAARHAGLEGGHGRPFLVGSPMREPDAVPSGGAIDLARTLKGLDMKALVEALLSAFPDRASLEQLVSFGLGVRLNTISDGKPLSGTVFDLVNWAGSRGRYADLLKAARDANPGNATLRTFAARCEAPATSVGPTWDADTKRKFRGALTNACQTGVRLRMLAVDARVNVHQVDFSGSPDNAAFSLIEEAVRGGKLNALLAIAQREYPQAMAERGF